MCIHASDIYHIRDFYGLTQADVASLCNVSEAYINMIERQKRALTDGVRNRLMESLELNTQKMEVIRSAYSALEASRTIINKGDGR